MLAEKAKGSKPILAGAGVGEEGQVDKWQLCKEGAPVRM